MNKILLTVATILTFGVATAQDLSFGAKAGLNMSTLTGDVEDVKSIFGFHVGGFVEFKISEKFSLQPELLYSTQGAKAEYSENFDGFNVKISETVNLGYLNIPIMAKYYVSEKFNIQAGPQIGLNLSAKAKSEASFGGESFSETEDIKEDIEALDFGLNFGLGYNISEKIFIEGRYNLGLSNIIKDSGDEKVKNGVFQLSLGYRF
ncbi:MAG: porin family protein [Flavobacterium sp.]